MRDRKRKLLQAADLPELTAALLQNSKSYFPAGHLNNRRKSPHSLKILKGSPAGRQCSVGVGFGNRMIHDDT